MLQEVPYPVHSTPMCAYGAHYIFWDKLIKFLTSASLNPTQPNGVGETLKDQGLVRSILLWILYAVPQCNPTPRWTQNLQIALQSRDWMSMKCTCLVPSSDYIIGSHVASQRCVCVYILGCVEKLVDSKEFDGGYDSTASLRCTGRSLWRRLWRNW